MFWSWTAIAVIALIIALLTGRAGPLIAGVGAALAAWLHHLALPIPAQFAAICGGFLVSLLLVWRGSRR
jgi:uncharacterized membrane protein